MTEPKALTAIQVARRMIDFVDHWGHSSAPVYAMIQARKLEPADKGVYNFRPIVDIQYTAAGPDINFVSVAGNPEPFTVNRAIRQVLHAISTNPDPVRSPVVLVDGAPAFSSTTRRVGDRIALAIISEAP